MGTDDGDGHVRLLGFVSPKTAAFAAMLALGTVVYHALEGFTWIDSAYCATGVITTVGQVMVPVTPAGRAFTALFNISSLGIGVLAMMEVADARRDMMRRALRRGASAPSLSLEVWVLLATVVPSIVTTALLLMYTEGWSSYWEALYFCLVTASGM